MKNFLEYLHDRGHGPRVSIIGFVLLAVAFLPSYYAWKWKIKHERIVRILNYALIIIFILLLNSGTSSEEKLALFGMFYLASFILWLYAYRCKEKNTRRNQKKSSK